MTSGSTLKKRAFTVLGGTAAAMLVLAGCAGGGGDEPANQDITVGTTDKVTSIDPAGSYDNGSFAIMNNVYPFIMNSVPGSADVVPDIAESAEFTAPTEFTVKLKEGLTFANGNDLTASDVKFSFDRQTVIADDNGPWALLYNLEETEAVDDTTVVFHLKEGNDQIWPQILSSPAAPIVDEEVFAADAVTDDDDIVAANAFAGQYVISTYNFNELVQFKAFADYEGVLGEPKSDTINLKYYADSSNLKLEVQEGNIDVATRSLSATDIEDLEGDDDVTVDYGPGGEIRYIVFNFNIMPFGATTPEADAGKALAVRQAMADLIDREEIATQVYKGTYLPLYSYVPEGLTGATESLKPLYGDGDGGPDAVKAAERLTTAGITEPVELNLQYNPDHYGPSSGDEYALIKSQLEKDGLFTVSLQSTEWVTYADQYPKDAYPLFQLGWFPDYSDADNYLSPFFQTENFIGNHFSDPELDRLIPAQAVEMDPDTRVGLIEEIQDKVAAQLSTLPLLQGAQVAVSAAGVTGVADTLDGSFKFRFGVIGRG